MNVSLNEAFDAVMTIKAFCSQHNDCCYSHDYLESDHKPCPFLTKSGSGINSKCYILSSDTPDKWSVKIIDGKLYEPIDKGMNDE